MSKLTLEEKLKRREQKKLDIFRSCKL